MEEIKNYLKYSGSKTVIATKKKWPRTIDDSEYNIACSNLNKAKDKKIQVVVGLNIKGDIVIRLLQKDVELPIFHYDKRFMYTLCTREKVYSAIFVQYGDILKTENVVIGQKKYNCLIS